MIIDTIIRILLLALLIKASFLLGFEMGESDVFNIGHAAWVAIFSLAVGYEMFWGKK